VVLLASGWTPERHTRTLIPISSMQLNSLAHSSSFRSLGLPLALALCGQGLLCQSLSGQGFSGQGFSGQGFSGQDFSGQDFSGQGLSGQGVSGLGLHGSTGLVPALTAAGFAVGGSLDAPPRVLVSTTSDLDPVNNLPSISDAGLPMVGGMQVASAHFVDLHWQGVLGYVPTDVDAVARIPGAVPGSAESLAFSLLSNEGGVKDGDVIVLDGLGGMRPFVTEDTILAAIGRTDADIDLDGIAFDEGGLLLFSLQSDLDNTVLGSLADGDILRLELNGGLTRVLSEAEVQTRFTLATGSTGSIGDVNGIEWVGGEPWVTTQGPSSWDGAVVAVGVSPIVLLDETLVGLGGAELDALSYARPGDEIPSFSTNVIGGSAGDSLLVDFFGSPNAGQLVLFSGAASTYSTPTAGGFGSLYLDPSDMWFQSTLSNLGANFVALDATGYKRLTYTLPISAVWALGFAGEEGWSFQTLDITSLELSAPGRILRF
jgi:hypothetical protein